MSTWSIGSLTERPSVTLRDWRVFEVRLDEASESWTRHLVGWACEDHQGQVCSPVMQFDPATAQFMTRSGRIYSLVGAPGLNQDAAYVWARWKRIFGVSQERDVTDVVAEAIAAAASKGSV